jgi:serine/threonine-protein kinase RsbW/stage II sporulation protein AB (anti-sigma F factor)
VDRRLPASPEHVRTARNAIREVLEVNAIPLDGDAVAVCVSEAVTNVLMHAYPEGGGDFSLTGDLAGDELVVTVADRGRGIVPREDSPGAGLGLGLIDALADRVELDRGVPGGGRVTMHFSFTGRSTAGTTGAGEVRPAGPRAERAEPGTLEG